MFSLLSPCPLCSLCATFLYSRERPGTPDFSPTCFLCFHPFSVPSVSSVRTLLLSSISNANQKDRCSQCALLRAIRALCVKPQNLPFAQRTQRGDSNWGRLGTLGDAWGRLGTLGNAWERQLLSWHVFFNSIRYVFYVFIFLRALCALRANPSFLFFGVPRAFPMCTLRVLCTLRANPSFLFFGVPRAFPVCTLRALCALRAKPFFLFLAFPERRPRAFTFYPLTVGISRQQVV